MRISTTANRQKFGRRVAKSKQGAIIAPLNGRNTMKTAKTIGAKIDLSDADYADFISSPEPLHCARTFAEKLRVQERTVYLYVKKGLLQHCRLGGGDGAVRFLPRHIKAFLKASQAQEKNGQAA